MKVIIFDVLVALCALVLVAGIVLACIVGDMLGVWMVVGAFVCLIDIMVYDCIKVTEE